MATPAVPSITGQYSVDYLVGLLVLDGALTDEQANQARKEEAQTRAQILRDKAAGGGRKVQYEISPVEVIADFRFKKPDGLEVDGDVMARAIAKDARLPFEKPDPLKLDMELIAATMTRPYARRHSCVPLRREDGKVVIAVDNPYNAQLLDDLRQMMSSEIAVVVSSKMDIQRIITEVYGIRSSLSRAEADVRSKFDLGNLEQLVQLKDVREIEATDKPIINAVEYLLHYAFEQRASDIHIEPKREQTVVRMRIDGVLHNVYSFPRVVHPAFTSRVKMLARMDIAEKRRPQDGRIKTQQSNREVELRVSTLSVAFGEKIVIRIFDPEAMIQALDTIGFYAEDLQIWRRMFNRPTGLVLVTGPTGSGKTTTLYSTLKELASPDVNITTVEDPIEMVHEEFNQTLVQRKIDMSFANALRTILRQDPDIIMVGEIRDIETANMAVQAALTGHLVLSTLHTNDAAATVTRLIDLGVEPYLISSTLIGVMAQRLVRKICRHCKTETTLTADQIGLLNIKLPPGSERTLPVHYGNGCIRCRDTGYYGRSGVFELLEVDDSVRRLIADNATAPELRRAAKANGMMSLRECAIKKLAQGVTTFEEVVGVSAEVK